MSSLSENILAVLLPFTELFSKTSAKKALTLLIGVILCQGKRTVCSALRAMNLSHDKSFSKYHHLLNRSKWSPLQGARILLLRLLSLVEKDAPIVLTVDETVERRKGKKIKSKGYYRDAVRSSTSQVVKTSGLKWIVMCVTTKLAFMKRIVSLPFFSVLEHSKKCNEKAGKAHKTTIDWTKQMLCQTLRWIGKAREIVFLGDGGFAVKDLASFCIKNKITLISRLKINARLHYSPPEKVPNKRGRPRKKGDMLPKFKEMINSQDTKWKEAEVNGYGGKIQKVRFISGVNLWGCEGGSPIQIRWVLIFDPKKKTAIPLMSTDINLSPEEIIEFYISRWSIEVTFEEVREHLGVETQRQWSDKSIARSTPALMGLYSLLCLMGNLLNQEGFLQTQESAWYTKNHITFSDILKAVRMVIWRENLILQEGESTGFGKNITPKIMEWGEAIVKRMLQAA